MAWLKQRIGTKTNNNRLQTEGASILTQFIKIEIDVFKEGGKVFGLFIVIGIINDSCVGIWSLDLA
jgi:hypothetical protein